MRDSMKSARHSSEFSSSVQPLKQRASATLVDDHADARWIFLRPRRRALCHAAHANLTPCAGIDIKDVARDHVDPGQRNFVVRISPTGPIECAEVVSRPGFDLCPAVMRQRRRAIDTTGYQPECGVA